MPTLPSGALARRSCHGSAALHLDARTIAVSLACLFASTLLCSLLAGRPPRFQGGRAMAQRDHGRDLLIVSQVALASVLLLAAGLLLHSFLRLRAVDPGFDPDRILAVHVNLAGPGYDDARRVAFFRDATALLGAAAAGRIRGRHQHRALQRPGNGESLPHRRRARRGGIPLRRMAGCNARIFHNPRPAAEARKATSRNATRMARSKP